MSWIVINKNYPGKFLEVDALGPAWTDRKDDALKFDTQDDAAVFIRRQNIVYAKPKEIVETRR